MGAAPVRRTVAPLSRASTTNLVMVLCWGAALAAFSLLESAAGAVFSVTGEAGLGCTTGLATAGCGSVAARLPVGALFSSGFRLGMGARAGASLLALGSAMPFCVCGGRCNCDWESTAGAPSATGGAASGGVTGAMIPAGVAGSGLRMRSLSMISAMPRTQTATRRLRITLFMPKGSCQLLGLKLPLSAFARPWPRNAPV